MSVHLTLTCDGCPDTTTTVGPLRRRFLGFNGSDHGVGVFAIDDPTSLTPEGWVMFDPYTQATYCPDCWAVLLDAWREAADA